MFVDLTLVGVSWGRIGHNFCSVHYCVGVFKYQTFFIDIYYQLFVLYLFIFLMVNEMNESTVALLYIYTHIHT